MPPRVFAVTRVRGPRYDLGKPMEEQVDWLEHARFMDALESEGFIALGGPLEGSTDVLLIVRATDPEEIERRLGDDVWSQKDLLRIKHIAPWTIRLGAL